ncbi:amino acid permease-domain-containing protein [Gamsiella multidivaricata]|uniref:amino acid permease-domain-containing protein n=1 Tax=Gamsiella multidivaricata TaxID=101098 RepID=UPI00221FEE7E|nr:amino acid permease-domain-containing protein [Gamsiella multidivaricata]KAI7819136.1 amino acid permease-domain-containing protein [Gamsiella multidivaricata]
MHVSLPQTADSENLQQNIPMQPFPTTTHTTHTGDGTFLLERLSASKRAVRAASFLITLDDYNLISLGYKPVMSRSLSPLTLIGITLTASNVLCGVTALYALPLTNGGPAWAIWSYLIVGIMSCIVSLCLAELAAAYPTVAGVHHWVYRLASSHQRRFLTWMTGWLAIAGAIASASSIAFCFSSMLGQVLSLTYRIEPTPGMLVMFHLGAVLSWQGFNLLSVRGFGFVSAFSGIYNLGATVALIIILLTIPPLVDASMIRVSFTAFLNYSGSTSAIYARLSSALMASFVFCPQDTIIRMAEETRRPERIIPKLIIGSNAISLVLGSLLIIGLNYGVIHPMKGLLEAIPAVRVLLVALGRHLGIIFVSMTLVGIFFTGLTRLTLATRVAYAFSRDAGLPKSSYWNHLHGRRKTPQRVSWVVAVACMAGIFPFYWGDIDAFHWIASIACVTTNLSFVVPLWIMLTREGALNHIAGAFTLGPLSRLIYTISILWLLFLSTILLFPMTFPLTRGNFNYAPAAILCIIIFAALSWSKAKYGFTGTAKDHSGASHRISSPLHYRSCTTPSIPRIRVAPLYHSSTSKHQIPLGPQPLHSFSHLRTESDIDGISFTSKPSFTYSRGRTGPSTSDKIQEPQRAQSDRSLSRSLGTMIDSRSQSQGRDMGHRHHRDTSGQQSERIKDSALTITTQTSKQIRAQSTLGIPLFRSPEMVLGDIRTVRSLSTPSSHSFYQSMGFVGGDGSQLQSVRASSEFELTGPVLGKNVVPPTTVSSRNSQLFLATTDSKKDVVLTQSIGETQRVGRYSGLKESSPSTRPPNATESIFPGLTHTTIGSNSSGESRYAIGTKLEHNVESYFNILKNHRARSPLSSPETIVGSAVSASKDVETEVQDTTIDHSI